MVKTVETQDKTRLVLLVFGDVKRYGRRRTEFRAASENKFVPKRVVALDNSRIYAIYRTSTRIYVVYETTKLEFYKHYAAEVLPEDAELVNEITVGIPMCPRCGSTDIEIEEDGEMVCFKCGLAEFWHTEEVTVYRLREFDWSQVEVLKPPTRATEVGIVTRENAAEVLRAFLEEQGLGHGEIVEGWSGMAGEDRVAFASNTVKTKIGNAEITVGPGIPVSRSWDTEARYGEPGIYAAIEFDVGDRETSYAHYYTKIKELSNKDVAALIPVALNIAGINWTLEKFGRERVAEALRGDKEMLVLLAMRGFTDTLAELGLADTVAEAVKTEIEATLESSEPASSRAIALEALVETLRRLGAEVPQRYVEALEVLRREVEEEEKKRIEEEKRKAEEEKQVFIEELRTKIPGWADGVAVVSEVIRDPVEPDIMYYAVPVKKSKYSPNQYYYAKNWKSVTWGYKLHILDGTLILKDKTLKHRKIRENEKYVTLEAIGAMG